MKKKFRVRATCLVPNQFDLVVEAETMGDAENKVHDLFNANKASLIDSQGYEPISAYALSVGTVMEILPRHPHAERERQGMWGIG